MLSTMQDVPLTVTAIMRHACGVNGDRTVTSPAADGGYRTITYREVGQQAARLANALRRLGITGDERVGTFMWNNTEHLIAYLAVPAMGAVLHTLNIRLSAEQIAFIADDAEDRVIIVDGSLVGLLAPVLADTPTVHTLIVTGEADPAPLRATGKTVLRWDEVLAAESDAFDWPELDERSAAAMCYTSGTTGNPKGVVYSHRSTYLHAQAVCTANALGVSVADRVLPVVPMFHANAWGLPYAALAAGADLVMPDRFLGAEALVDLVETQRPTLAGAVPTIWNDVLHYLDANPGRDVSSLRMVACGGSAVPVSLIREFERYGVTVQQAWGMTETSPIATVAHLVPGLPEEQVWPARGSQGRPICGVEARIVDDAGNPVPHDGESVGELEVRGPWITGAYYRGRDPERFDNGWLRTGDVGRIDPWGYVTLTDRAKDVIKSGGEWISSVELENHLIAHPEVLEAAVVGVPDERWQERPLAVVVLHEGATVDAEGLRAFLAERVVRWWLPERWTFVDQVPRTSVGKYDKKVIRARYAEGHYAVTLVTPPREQT
ncbi:fatty acid--CoA ligase [uncultured Mycolicibacterium sp.]|uniref:fatty acid--CoA ligase n=1 Tax=uncultured Mycolicibacterium sp. TaxID=2320817 RepID=UPI00262A9E44|nr:fatty acid--CoA ligase [uncultured Mycolicibacterium sp.]